MLKWHEGNAKRGGIYRVEGKKIYRALGNNEFSPYSQKLPENVSYHPISMEQEEYFCTTKEKQQRKQYGMQLTVEEWIDYMRNKVFTIKDLKKLREKKKIAFLHVSSHLQEIKKENDSNQLYTPKKFFRNHKLIYQHGKHTKGHMNHEPFEFHVYEEGIWKPIHNGKVGKKQWKEYPDKTIIGCNGALIPWNCIQTKPLIFYS